MFGNVRGQPSLVMTSHIVQWTHPAAHKDFWKPIMVVLVVVDISITYRLLAERESTFVYVGIVLVVECSGENMLLEKTYQPLISAKRRKHKPAALLHATCLQHSLASWESILASFMITTTLSENSIIRSTLFSLNYLSFYSILATEIREVLQQF
jgi:hypothetical protein